MQLLLLCGGLSLVDLGEGDLGHGGASSDEVSQELSVCARHVGGWSLFEVQEEEKLITGNVYKGEDKSMVVEVEVIEV